MTITPSPIPNSFVANTGKTIQLQIIDVGPLDMNATNFLNFDCGIDRTKIIGISWRINKDNGVISYIGPIGVMQGWTESVNASVIFEDSTSLGPTTLYIQWDNLGVFKTDVQYSGTAINRMTLMIWYLS